MPQETKLGAGKDSRRSFIQKTATAAAAVAVTNMFKTPVYGQNQAPSTGRVIGANDRISVGYIGIGGQGFNAHVRQMKEHAAEHNILQAACCDVSKHRVAEVKDFIEKDGGGKCDGYTDYRKVLERKDIDAIVCATVDHWHQRISMEALDSGKHVYVEKPMCRYLGEAFDLHDKVKSTGKILQVGSQGCSDQKWHKAAEWIKGGKIGPIVMCQGSYMRNSPKGEWNYPIQDWATSQDIDWATWIAPISHKVDFNADHYFRWRKYQPYCAGLLGDLFPHKLHPYMLATGNPEFPVRVAAVGTKAIHTDKNTPDTPERDVPEIIQMIAEFPSGMVMHITSSSINETGTQELIRGHKANLYMNGNRVELKPEKAFAEEIDAENSESFPAEAIPPHHANWFASIRQNKQPNAGIELAVRVQTVISLAEMSQRLNVMCNFDEKTRKITVGDGKFVPLKEIKPLTYGMTELS
jgi:predicted dehydrogenase